MHKDWIETVGKRLHVTTWREILVDERKEHCMFHRTPKDLQYRLGQDYCRGF